MANERMSAEVRTAQLVEAGYNVAKKCGFKKVTRVAVAAATATSVGLINRYFEGRDGLRGAVMAHAVRVKDAKVLADAAARYDLPAMPRALAKEVKALLASA